MPLANTLFAPPPAAAPAPMSDADLFAPNQAAPQTQPVAVQLSDADLFTPAQPAAQAAPMPSLWDRATANFRDSAKHSLQGAAANIFDATQQDTVVRNLRAQGQTEAADRYVLAGQQALERQRTQDAAMPAWNSGGLWDDITRGGAALAGQVAGSLVSPEGLVTKLPGIGTAIEAAAQKVAGKVLPKIAAPIGSRVVESGLTQAAVNTATDPAVQGLNVAAGKQEAFDPVELALAPVLGFAVGSTVHGATELKGAADAFRSWRAGRGVAPEAPITPDEVATFKGSPELQAFLQAQGAPLPTEEVTATAFSDRLAARRAKEAAAANPQDAGGSKLSVFNKDQERLRTERDSVLAGETDPQAASTAGRVPRQELPPVIPVDAQGRADVGDLGVKAGIDKAAEVKEGVYRQANQAFRMAEVQRDRAGAVVRDTQPAPRPQGVDQQPVHLDEGFPVQILDRKTKNVGGRDVEMATVHRYDPRTGQVDPEAVPYEVPVRQLKTKNYAKEPRLAQDFDVRAQSPLNPERPRTADQTVTREPDQTYRTTAADNNADFPGATRPGPEDGAPPQGRSPFPKQPEGPGPFRERPTNEDAAIRDFEAREKARKEGREDDFFREQRAKGPRPEDNKTSTKAKPVNAEGRFDIDDRGFVASDKGGPMKFADQKQAAKWIINEGHKKSRDQIFEIENHPSGKGFGVRERGRAEAKPDNEPPPSGSSSQGKAGGAAAGSKGGSPGALPPPKPQASPEQRASARDDVATARAPEGKTQKRGSLFDTIRELGGIRDDRGDVRQIMQGYKSPRFKKRVVHEGGQHPDKIREALQEKGWFGPTDFNAETGTRSGDDIRDLYDMMDREARGEPVYHPEDRATDGEMDADLRRSLDEELDQAGIKDSDTDEVAAEKLAEYRAKQERDFAEQQRHIDELPRDLDQESVDGYQREPEGPAEAGSEQSGGAEARASDDIPGWEEEVPGGSDSRASGSERQGAEGNSGARSEPRQTRVEGTEREATAEELRQREARKRAEEKQQNPRAHNDAKQKPADDGLFADRSEENQTDMFADPKQADAAKRARDTFYSNPAADPESWRELGRMLKDAFGWAKDEADAWTREMRHSMSGFGKYKPEGETRFQRSWNATRPMRQWVEKMAYSNDGRLRSLAARYKSDALRDIADKFFAAPRGGEGRAVGEDYFQSISRRRTQWLNQIDEVMDPFKDMELGPQHEAMKQIGRLVQNPGAIRAGTPVGDAATAIKRVLKDALQYLREAGVDVGEVKDGYLPRVENTEGILKDPKGFLAAATRAYTADGVPLKDAQKAAEAWLNRVRLGDWGVHNEGSDFSNIGGGYNVFTKGRSLSKKADEIMGDFFLRNPADIIPSYVNRAVQKAEWSRRFGKRDANAVVPKSEDKAAWLSDPDGKWKDIKQRLIDEGNGAIIPDTIGIIRSITGNMGDRLGASGAAKGALSLARTWSALTYLPRSMFASLSEPVNIAIRTGNTLDVARAYGETVRQLIPGVKKTAGAEYLHGLASDLGFIGESIDSLTMLQRIGGENGGLLAKKIQGKFFKANGLTALTEANRVASVKIGMTFIRRLAKDVTDKTPYNNIARRMFNELGIGADKVDAFARYVSGLDKPSAKDLKAGGDHGEAYQVALGRFVQNTVMAPSGAVKPYYAQHPLGSLIYNLQSFNFAFQKNVLNRVGAMTKEALNPKSGLNGHERLYALMPLMNLAPLIAVTYGVSQLRDALFEDPARKGRPEPTNIETAKRVASRAGLTGSWDMYFNALTGARYQHDPLVAALGPILGGADTIVGNTLDTMSDRNSPNTNTQERKLAASTYSFIVQPALEAGLLAAAPETRLLGKVAGTTGVYLFSHPGTRETFVRSVAGPPLPPS